MSDLTAIIETNAKMTPDVPLADGLDVAAFGDDPMFVTLPIAQMGAVSKNGYRYSTAVVHSLVEQINQQKPEGHWGHVPMEARATHYQAPAVRWVGALLDAAGVVWAKAIAITPEAREHFRVAQAAQAPIGTSLYGVATMEGDEVIGLALESIDLADAARVGVAEAVAAPVITAEMTSATGSKPMAMDGQSLMNEAGDNAPVVTNDPDAQAVRRVVMEQAGLLRQAGIEIGVDTSTEVIVRGLITQVAQLHAQQLLAQIQAIITETVKLAPLRTVIAEMMGVPQSGQGTEAQLFVNRWRGVIAEMGAAENPELLHEAVRGQVIELMGRPHVQAVARALVSELMGPSVMVGANLTPRSQQARGREWDTPEKRAEVRSRFGF